MAKFTLADGTEIEAFTAEEVEKLTESKVSGLKNKVSELLTETKAEREKRQQIEAEREAAELERMQKDNDLQGLLERERKKAEEFSSKVSELSEKLTAKEKKEQADAIEKATSEFAMMQTRDTAKMKLLREQAAKYAKFTENGVQFEVDGVVIDSNKLTEKLISDYGFLFDGSGANGGGSQGSKFSGADNKTNAKADEAKSKGDLNGFLAAALTQNQ